MFNNIECLYIPIDIETFKSELHNKNPRDQKVNVFVVQACIAGKARIYRNFIETLDDIIVYENRHKVISNYKRIILVIHIEMLRQRCRSEVLFYLIVKETAPYA